MNYNDIVELAEVFEKMAQVTVENTDPVTPVLQKAGFMDSSNPSFMKALQLAANKGVVQQGSTFDISFKIGPKNVVIFTFNPPNDDLMQIFSKVVGRAMKMTLDQARVDGNGYVKNSWLNWGWV